MKKLVLAALTVLSIGNAAQAALVLHVPDIALTQSASVQTGSFDVYLEETLGTEVNIQSYNVGLRQSPTGIVTFTGINPSSATHPMVISAAVLDDNTANRATYVAGQDLYVTNDSSSPVAVANGVKDGLFSVSYSIPANAVGTVTINIDSEATRLFPDGGINPLVYVAAPGSITITPIPEPAAMGLALLAVPLLARRRS